MNNSKIFIPAICSWKHYDWLKSLKAKNMQAAWSKYENPYWMLEVILYSNIVNKDEAIYWTLVALRDSFYQPFDSAFIENMKVLSHLHRDKNKDSSSGEVNLRKSLHANSVVLDKIIEKGDFSTNILLSADIRLQEIFIEYNVTFNNTMYSDTFTSTAPRSYEILLSIQSVYNKNRHFFDTKELIKNLREHFPDFPHPVNESYI